MLTTLVIKDFAIISELELSFGPGMTVLSGETGAGKSIIINAMKLLLGGRGSSDIVRSGAREAVVEGMFTIEPGQEQVRRYLTALGIRFEDDEFVVRRTIPRSGRGHIFIGGTLQSLATLRDLMRCVADISGQHEHVSLLDNSRHLSIVDRFAGLESASSTFAETYRQYMALKRERDTLAAQVEERARRLDFLNYEIHELETAQVKPGESDAITKELKRLDHASQWKQTLTMALDGLYENDGSVVSRLGTIIREMRAFVAYDSEVERICSCLNDARSMVMDSVHDLRACDDQDESPERQAELQARLVTIDKLERKYRVKADNLKDYCASLCRERETLVVSDTRCGKLDVELKCLQSSLESMAKELGVKRHAAAAKLEKEATAMLHLLAMEHARIYVKCETEETFTQFRSTGAETVEFLLQPNPGEAPKPLAKIASGGELSRVLLAIKRVLVDRDEVPTYVFDEVDTGIGGVTANHVAAMLKEVSRRHQVFCITHLASIACYADTQFQVSKSVVGDRTESHILLLDEEARILEIARMLGGPTITDKTKEHAAEMIAGSRAEAS